jgi:hypothetical protein
MAKSKYGEFDSKEEVLDYITDVCDTFEGEGLEEAYKIFMKRPIE